MPEHKPATDKAVPQQRPTDRATSDHGYMQQSPSCVMRRPSDILALQRTVGNREVGQLLAQPVQHQLIEGKRNKINLFDNLKESSKDISNVSTISKPIVQRIIYQNIDELLVGVLPDPRNRPNVNDFSKTLQSLFADAANQLPLTDVRHVPQLKRAAEADWNPAPPPTYIINYNPTLKDSDYLISSMLHELLHVSTEQNYRKNGVKYDWLNVHLPPGVILPQSVGTEINNQLIILKQNIGDAQIVTTNDVRLPPAIRKHVLDRLDLYADQMPDVHYDTVIAEIMAYLELNNISSGSAYDFIERMVKESTDRRLSNPWWGTKSARRVDINTSFWQYWKW